MYKKIFFLAIALLAFSISNFAETKHNKEFTIVIESANQGLLKDISNNEKNLEKELSASYIQELKRVAELNNFRVVLVDAKDNLTSVAKRNDFLKQNKANLFVSLYFNKNQDISKRGFECYVPYDNNAVENRYVGKFMGADLYQVAGMKFNGVNVEKKTILNGLIAPSTLLGLGYLSNNDDLKILESNDSRTEICTRIVNAIQNYKNQLELDK